MAVIVIVEAGSAHEKVMHGVLTTRRECVAISETPRYSSGMTRHCWKCGWEWTLSGQPGRSESCPQCRSDLRVCLNCVSYDVRAAQQCRDRRAEPVEEKHVGNFCEYFEFVRRAFAASDGENPRETSARERMKKLLGD